MNKITQKNVVEFLNSENTKSQKGMFLEFDSEVTVLVFRFCMKYINFSETDMRVIKIDIFKENYFSLDPEVKYNVVNKDLVYMMRIMQPYTTDVSEAEVQLALAAHSALAGVKEVPIDVSERMYGLCDMLARDLRIKFYRRGNQPCFSFYALKSISEQILNKVRAGEQKIIVSMDDLSESTARVYCTRIKKKTGKQLSCTVSGRKIIFYAGEINSRNQYENKLRDLVESFSSIQYHTLVDCTNAVISEFAPKILKISESDKKLLNVVPVISEADQPLWMQYGYETEQEYLDYQKQKEADIEDWNAADEAEEDEQEQEVETVDGLKQFIIPGIRESITVADTPEISDSNESPKIEHETEHSDNDTPSKAHDYDDDF